MTMTLSPSNLFVRTLYCASLVIIAFSLFRIFGVFNFKAGGELLILAATAPTVMLILVVVLRFVGIVTGKFKLNVAATSGPIYVLRMVAIFLMFTTVAVAVFSLIGGLSSSRSDGAAFAVVSGILGGGSPIGLVLFEASRILERELLHET